MCILDCGQLQALICYNQFSEYIFNFRINASKQPQSILRRLFRCMLDVVMMTKLLTYECKTLPVNNFVLFTVRVCTDLIHWLLHLCCRNWGLPSWQNWFREGSQGANDTWNDYYEKEIKCLLSIQQWNKLVYNLFSNIRPGPESRKESQLCPGSQLCTNISKCDNYVTVYPMSL